MFDVRGAESFQADYQRLVETWLRKFTEIEENLEREPTSQEKPQGEKDSAGEPQKIEVRGQDDQLIYGELDDGKKVCTLVPEQMRQLEEAIAVKAGERVEGLPSLKVKVEGKTFFESQDEKVIVNRKSDQEFQWLQQNEYKFFDELSDEDHYSPHPTPEIGVELEPEPALDPPKSDSVANLRASALVEMIVPIIEAMPTVVEEPAQSLQKEDDLFFELSETLTLQSEPTELEEKRSTEVRIPTQDTSVQLPQKSGLDAVQSALGEMKEGSLKSLLQGVATDMQATTVQQPPNPALATLLSERSQEPSNTQWWQKLSTKVERMVTAVQENFTQHRAASTLKDLANRMALQPGDSFEGADYHLSRQGKDYILTDKQGHELMKFQSSPLGVRVDPSLPVLDDSHFRKTEQLRLDFKEGRPPGGSFMSQGAAEANHLQRIHTITQALSQYAAVQGGKAKVEGTFNYRFEANSSGSAIIRDQEGKTLLAVRQGEMRSRMSEKDLQHFEQMLPALLGSIQPATQTKTKPLASSGKQLEI